MAKSPEGSASGRKATPGNPGIGFGNHNIYSYIKELMKGQKLIAKSQ